MKLLFENWRQYLKENEELSVVTFDFDDTLSRSRWDEEAGEYRYIGPYSDMLRKIKKYINDPNIKVYVVTSRYKKFELKALENPEQISVNEFLDKNGLTVDGVYFTNGELKIEKLLELGSSMHHDDDPDEINAAKENGIITVISDPYGDYSSLEKGNF